MVKAKISDYILGVIVFSLFITAGVSVLSIFKTQDSSFGGDRYAQFNSSFNKLNELNSTIGGYSDTLSTSNNNDEFGVLGVLNALILKAWQSLRGIGTSFSFMGSVFSSSASMFGIPNFFVTGIALIISTIIIFAIWSAIFQRDI